MAKKDPTPWDGFKDATLRTYDSDSINPADYISTGIYLLDGLLGRIGAGTRRGIGTGKIVEIYGENRTCKSELTRCITRSFMNQCFFGSKTPNGVSVFFDQEHATDTDKFRAGIPDPQRAVFGSVPTLEHFYVNVSKFQKNMVAMCLKPGLVVMDSLAACHTIGELKREIDAAALPAAKAQIHSRALSKLRSVLSETHTSTIFVNQTRDKVGDDFVKTDSTGGKAIKYYADYRLALRHVSNFWITTGDKRPKVDYDAPHGMIIEVMIIKNKLDTPMRKMKIHMLFRPSQGIPSGISPMWTMFYNLKEYDAIKVRGGKNHFAGHSFEKREWKDIYMSYTDANGVPNGPMLEACEKVLSKMMPESFEFPGDEEGGEEEEENLDVADLELGD